MQTKILGVHITVATPSDIQHDIRSFLLSSQSHTLFTPNPEMIVQAYYQKNFQDILNTADIAICDGFGIRLMSLISKKIPVIPRYPGSDCMLDVCRIAEDMGKRIFLLGTGNKKTLEHAVDRLRTQFPALRIVGMHAGPHISRLRDGSFAVSEDINSAIIDDIIDVAPDIIFVAFGHGKQEWWIHRYRKELPSVRLAMGVGGSIDFIAGRVRRAPLLFRRVGLEWMWRMCVEPWRITRIMTAVIVFPYLFFVKQNNQ